MGFPVSGDSLAFFNASWNFFSSRPEAFFCASTDCRKIDSLRLSCSFMARAASSMSLNILGFTAAVCAITARSCMSTFNTALQQGQVTSKAISVLGFPMQQNHTANECLSERLLRIELNGEHVKGIKQLPNQHSGGCYDHQDSQYLSKTHALFVRIEPLYCQAENVDGGKAKNQRPKDVKQIVSFFV